MPVNDPNAENRNDSGKRRETEIGESSCQRQKTENVDPTSKSPTARRVHIEPDLIFDEIVESAVGTRLS